MTRTYYKLLYQLDGVEAFLLWFTNDVDGVIKTPQGRILSFPTEEELVAFACDLGVTVIDEDPILHNLDAVEAWASTSSPETVDCSELLSAWNLFGDIERSLHPVSCVFAGKNAKLDSLYDKLFWGNNLPAMTPEGKRFDPVWSSAELSSLSKHITNGLELFRESRDGAV